MFGLRNSILVGRPEGPNFAGERVSALTLHVFTFSSLKHQHCTILYTRASEASDKQFLCHIPDSDGFPWLINSGRLYHSIST